MAVVENWARGAAMASQGAVAGDAQQPVTELAPAGVEIIEPLDDEASHGSSAPSSGSNALRSSHYRARHEESDPDKHLSRQESGRLPSEPVAFSAFVPLTGSSGTGKIELVAVRLDTLEQIYSQQGEVSFPDHLAVVHAHFRVSKIRFPTSGFYAFLLLVDGDLIAQRRIEVYLRESLS